MDYLEEARDCIGQVQRMDGNGSEDQTFVQLAIACALVAIAEGQAALIERLDALIWPDRDRPRANLNRECGQAR